MSTTDREFDVVVFGATGFTGRLVAAYLAERYRSAGLRLVIAGRTVARLEEVRASLGLPELPILVADAGDPASLDAMAKRTRVVCTTVGPYSRYGADLVAACVDRGTSYCDLSGEVPFIRASIDRWHERANAEGTRIVHCCGFDSVPSDLGVLLIQQWARDHLNAPCGEVRTLVGPIRGGFSGGTVASLLGVVSAARSDRGVARLLVDPYALNPTGERHGPDPRDRTGIHRDDITGQWTAPFLMAAINTRVVRRTSALLGWPWGRDFRYSEAAACGRGAGGFVRAGATAAGLASAITAFSVGPVRALLERTALPAPGEGPAPDQRQRGHFTFRMIGRLRDHDGSDGLVRARVRGFSDPGYSSTAMMLGESAACLARDELDTPGGVLTPAAAMGVRLIERLRAAGMEFDVLPADSR